MIIIDNITENIYEVIDEELKHITWNYKKIKEVVIKKFTKVEKTPLPHFINHIQCKGYKENEDVTIISFLHKKTFQISHKLIWKLWIKEVLWQLMGINNNIIKEIEQYSHWTVYEDYHKWLFPMQKISSISDMIKSSFIIYEKKYNKYRKWYASCSIYPVYKSIKENEEIELMECTWYWIATSKPLSKEKAISESLERMSSWIQQQIAKSEIPIHESIVKLYMWEKWLSSLKKDDLFICTSIFDKKLYSLPWNILYYPYKFNQYRNGNSNWVSCHTSEAKAIENALFELVERDAFMVSWLTKSYITKIIPSEHIQKKIDEQTYENYETHIFLLHYDQPLPVILTIIKRDKSIVCSMWTWYSLEDAITKSLEESGQFAVDHLNYSTEETHDDLIIEKHIKHYLKPENYKDIERIFSSNQIPLEKIEFTEIGSYEELLQYFEQRNINIVTHTYNTNITKTMNRETIRVISDQLIPIWFWWNDRPSIYNSKRIQEALKKVNKKNINKIIHPFG